MYRFTGLLSTCSCYNLANCWHAKITYLVQLTLGEELQHNNKATVNHQHFLQCSLQAFETSSHFSKTTDRPLSVIRMYRFLSTQKLISCAACSGVRPISRLFLNSDGLKHFRLISGLAEFTRKIENSANLWLNVNNCG